MASTRETEREGDGRRRTRAPMGAMIGAIASGGRSDFYDDDHDDPGSPPRPPATAKAEAALPTELVEVVPGRRVAVHHRSGRPQSDAGNPPSQKMLLLFPFLCCGTECNPKIGIDSDFKELVPKKP